MSFDPADPIGSVFADVIGKPCWNVRPGYGSAFLLEFGEPHLETVEPRVSTTSSEKLRKLQARRRVWIKGEWSLFIEFCGWRILEDGAVVIDSDRFSDTDPSTIKVLTEALDGQRLVGATSNGGGIARFEFDLGSVVETFPWAEMELGMWTFFTPEHRRLSYRTDGRYSWSPDEARDDEVEWLQVPH